MGPRTGLDGRKSSFSRGFDPGPCRLCTYCKYKKSYCLRKGCVPIVNIRKGCVPIINIRKGCVPIANTRKGCVPIVNIRNRTV